MSLIKKLFTEKLYVKISRNRFEIMKVSGDLAIEVVSPAEPFSTSRLLIGEFGLAERHLSDGIKKVLPKRFLKKSPEILMHPLEMIDGGLSEVEERILREMALGTGAHKVEIWLGGELTPQEAAKKLENA